MLSKSCGGKLRKKIKFSFPIHFKGEIPSTKKKQSLNPSAALTIESYFPRETKNTVVYTNIQILPVQELSNKLLSE